MAQDSSKAQRWKPIKPGHPVFMFQPTHYKVLETPEELRAWEELMATRVGIRGAVPQGTSTICACGGDFWDACDVSQ